MVNFQEISLHTFLSEYWQKKPLVIRRALPGFTNPLTPDELAGLALEEDVESRIVLETPGEQPGWHLKRGPFEESDFANLPQSHWTLLVQGVDRLVPEVYNLLERFDFIPQWRIDDVMISFAALKGGVGPHYDNYDVFLYQAKGSRHWSLTTQNCTTDNYLEDLELRIMKDFQEEEHFLLEEGDMLYLPPHVGHYGISASDECMTYSFGYRSYQGQEVWDSLGDYLSEQEAFKALYKDPDWSTVKNTSELTAPAWKSAQKLLLELVHNDSIMKSWFGCFATRLDQEAERQLPLPLEADELMDLPDFIEALKTGAHLERNASCRFAYQDGNQLFINGCQWEVGGVNPEVIALIANKRVLTYKELKEYLLGIEVQVLLYDLWKLQWLDLLSEL
ncbi:MAG: JmjC domain-containing protein [Legionellales bacterium]